MALETHYLKRNEARKRDRKYNNIFNVKRLKYNTVLFDNIKTESYHLVYDSNIVPFK